MKLRRMLKTISAVAVSASLIMSITACSNGGTSADSSDTNDTSTDAQEYLLIGNAQPLTGINAQLGEATTMAVELAVKHINENGGFNGVPLRLINYDDQNSPEEAVRVTQRMIQQDNVDLVLGSLLSSNLMATGDILQEAGLFSIVNGSADTFMQQGWDLMFRAGPNVALAMPSYASTMVAQGFERVSVIHGLDDATRSNGEAFMTAAKAEGLDIVAVETYIDGDTDFAGQISRMLEANPDVIMISSNGPTFPLVTRQLRLMDWDGPIFNREAPPSDAVSVAGDALDGVVFIYPYIAYEDVDQASDEYMIEFLQKFYDENGVMPFHDVAYRAWDAMMAMWEASKIAGANDSESLRDAMHQVQFRGLGGELDFTKGDREGHPKFVPWVMEAGRPVLLD
jgi:ABC-type branched-chain amino acid transport systems, periplasmic component